MKRRSTLLTYFIHLGAIAALFIAGCAPQAASQPPHQILCDGNPTYCIKAANESQDHSTDVYVDGTNVGSVAPGGKGNFEVAAGSSHEVNFCYEAEVGRPCLIDGPLCLTHRQKHVCSDPKQVSGDGNYSLIMYDADVR